MKSFKHQNPATVPAPSLGVLHFLFFSLIAGLFLVGLVSKISVLDVSSSRQEVTVFDKQSDSVADVSTLGEYIALRSIGFFVTVIVVVPNELLQSWQVNRLMNT